MLQELPYPEVTTSLKEQLSEVLQDISWMNPEGWLCILLLTVVVVDLIFKKKAQWLLTIITSIGLLLAAALLVWQWRMIGSKGPQELFMQMLTLDRLSIYFKAVVCLASLFTVLITFNYTVAQNQVKNDNLRTIGEYYVVLLGVALGAFMMTMSTNLLMIYLAVELVSLSSYILTNFSFTRQGAESGAKYILFGSVASGVMLYGMSILYGLTGSLAISQPVFIEGLSQAPELLALVGILLTLGGFLFKISAFPFHIWVPDVYQGAPTPIAAFFSVVPKIAAFVLLIRVTYSMIEVPTLPWQTILAGVAVFTIILGNFAALWQKNAKRMIAYSSIAHSGFLLVGVIASNQLGVSGVSFYAGVYALMNLAIFLLIRMISKETGVEEIEQYKGLGQKKPLLGVMTLVVMISLTGLPPTAGFTAKLLVFSSLWQAYQAGQNTLLLVLLMIGLFNTIISLFYYLKIPYYMFFKKSESFEEQVGFNRLEEHNQPLELKFNIFDKILAFVLIIPLLILFFKSNWLLELINTIPV